MTVTNEQIDSCVQYWRDHSAVNRHDGRVIVALADQLDQAVKARNANLVEWGKVADQRAELVALLQRVNLLGPSEQWVADRDALLARIGVTP